MTKLKHVLTAALLAAWCGVWPLGVAQSQNINQLLGQELRLALEVAIGPRHHGPAAESLLPKEDVTEHQRRRASEALEVSTIRSLSTLYGNWTFSAFKETNRAFPVYERKISPSSTFAEVRTQLARVIHRRTLETSTPKVFHDGVHFLTPSTLLFELLPSPLTGEMRYGSDWRQLAPRLEILMEQNAGSADEETVYALVDVFNLLNSAADVSANFYIQQKNLPQRTITWITESTVSSEMKARHLFDIVDTVRLCHVTEYAIRDGKFRPSDIFHRQMHPTQSPFSKKAPELCDSPVRSVPASAAKRARTYLDLMFRFARQDEEPANLVRLLKAAFHQAEQIPHGSQDAEWKYERLQDPAPPPNTDTLKSLNEKAKAFICAVELG